MQFVPDTISMFIYHPDFLSQISRTGNFIMVYEIDVNTSVHASVRVEFWSKRKLYNYSNKESFWKIDKNEQYWTNM